MSERTLSAHMCVQKRRHTDKDLTHVRLAFRTFQKFYEINMHNIIKDLLSLAERWLKKIC